MSHATPHHIPKEPGRWRALMLAGAVHLGLLAFLWFGVHWQSETPIAIEAEVWSPEVREAAPRPQPESVPEPQPQVKEAPKPSPAVEPPVVKPDIALEQEKKRKEKELKQREEELRAEQDRREKERLAKEEAARKQREAEQKKKELAEKKRKEEEAEAKLAQAREDNLKRLQAMAGSGGTGEAPQSQGPRGNADYIGRVGAKIKSNTIFSVPDSLAGNPEVVYAVELLPDGSIRRPVRKIKSSGVPGFDEAVLNAIEKSQPFPADRSGKVPSGFNVVHRPKDQ